MATRQAQQALVPGRLVLVSDPVTGLSALSAVLGEPQGYTAPSRAASATGAAMRSTATESLKLPQEQLQKLIHVMLKTAPEMACVKTVLTSCTCCSVAAHSPSEWNCMAGGSTSTTGRQYFVLSLHRPSPQDPPEAHQTAVVANGTPTHRGMVLLCSCVRHSDLVTQLASVTDRPTQTALASALNSA